MPLPLRRVLARCALPTAAVLLLAANVWLSHTYGHDYRMTTNPVYRWRESIAIALSGMRDVPTHRYLAYRSIRDHLAGHGLGLISGEANPLPTWKQVTDLIEDPVRLEKLIQEAARVPIDWSLPPVRIAGNEKGLADYYLWAFRLYGVNLRAPWLFYFTLLSVSVLVFLLTFRRSPLALYVLCLYLIGHLFMLGYANHGWIQTIHNSRFFPVLALLPSIQLLLMTVRRAPLTRGPVIAAAIQTFLLCFVVFCRFSASWQLVALLASLFLVVDPRAVLDVLRRPTRSAPAARAIARAAWPVMIVGLGALGLVVYSFVGQGLRSYRAETRTHVFWHPLFSGMVSASPELMKLYAGDQDGYSDGIVYMAVRADLRRRGESTSPIAYIHNGAIEIDILRGMGEYDRLVRRLFFTVLAEHPFLVLKSFVYDKPRDQLEIFGHAHLYEPGRYRTVVPLGLGVAAIYFGAGGRVPRRRDLRVATGAIGLVFVCSLLPTMVVPTALVVDSVLFYLMGLLGLVTFAPVALLVRGLRALTTSS